MTRVGVFGARGRMVPKCAVLCSPPGIWSLSPQLTSEMIARQPRPPK
jgi:hypothetical protein